VPILRERAGLVLITGGARSGKSAHAERLVGAFAPPWIYIATAQALDDEMAERIALHRNRRGRQWQTLEAPLDLCGALARVPEGAPVLIDCLTLWLSNQMLAGNDPGIESARLVESLAACRAPCFAVSNEVGQGIVPEHALSRRFRDAAGLLNQNVAAVAAGVILMVAGIPLQVK
jgi:adenosylcobinamide kinase/adenosylcobinamide-phosphate guanylyltransferase